MKKTVAVLFVLLFTALLCRFFLARHNPRTANLLDGQPPSEESASMGRDSAPPGSNPAPQSIAPTAAREPKDIREVAQASNVPINFWGKVLDQDGQPLPDVSINVRIRQWGFDTRLPIEPALLEPSFENVTLMTDQGGRFEGYGKAWGCSHRRFSS